ncbi:Methyltransferase domain-containing protein [Plasmodiophora brassicae]|uniref:Methyltransferase domain-containing protein n=1 Tax=Plasmodiophora brassicae TaxID=37360 RepID=A0A0G4IUR0_PLABS|nr:hypothetical protein PBRA_007124 [Plasmodiophora brassicae]SPQ98564.1 unnamed protein product [Plasmodiophora brassicae]
MRLVTSSTAANYGARATSFASWAEQQGAAARTARERLSEYRERPFQALLDVGCGSGRDAIAFARAGAGRVVGVDPCRDLVDIAIRNATSSRTPCTFHVGDIVDPPVTWDPALPDDIEFDGVFALASLFHIPKRDLPEALANIARTTSPDAVMLTTFPVGEGDGPMPDGRWRTALTMDEHDQLLASAGFAPVNRSAISIYNGVWDTVVSLKNTAT